MNENNEIENREDQKVYQVVNKYYYDIESSLVYFKTYNIFKQGKDQATLSIVLILLIIMIAYHLFVIIIGVFNFNTLGLYDLYEGTGWVWLGYILWLLIYVFVLTHLYDEKTKLLYKKYNTDSVIETQKKWISKNMPKTLNKLKLVEANRNWLGLLGKVSDEYNFSTGYILDNGIISKLISVMTPFLLIALSFEFLGAEFDKVAKEYPTETISLLIGILSIILVSIPVFFMVKNFMSRIFAAIDRENSKSSYRFNIFNRMLLHHVTLKELDETSK